MEMKREQKMDTRMTFAAYKVTGIVERLYKTPQIASISPLSLGMIPKLYGIGITGRTHTRIPKRVGSG